MHNLISCSVCGEKIYRAANFCGKCGARVDHQAFRETPAHSNLREPTTTENSGFRQKTIFESTATREKTVLESSGLREKTTVELPEVRERTMLEPGSATKFSAKPAHAQPASPPAARFVEPTVFIGAEHCSSGAPRLAGWLVGIEGPGEGQDHRLYAGKNAIGRHPNSGVLISDNSVSGDHAVIWIENGTLTIADQNSTNGVQINKSRIFQPSALNDGDLIAIGKALLQVVLFHQREVN